MGFPYILCKISQLCDNSKGTESLWVGTQIKSKIFHKYSGILDTNLQVDILT